MSEEIAPALVSEKTTQVGEIRSRWPWVEPSIWTDRMLAALERGIEGNKWYSLCDKAFSLQSLRSAFAKVKANDGAKGVDGVTISRFEENLDANLEHLHRQLMAGEYRPHAVRRVWIPKPGTSEKRPLGIPTVKDRVIQTAIKAAIEPIFERKFCDCSFGFRPGRSCHQALSRVWKGLRRGEAYIVDADLRKFFDTIPHQVILDGLEEEISDGKLLALVGLYLKQGVMDGWSWEPTDEGTPQGSVISPLLANIALHSLDLLARDENLNIVRYADDFVILCTSLESAQAALRLVQVWSSSVGLNLHPEKTQLVDYGNGMGFDFLGFTFCRGDHRPSKKNIQKVRDLIRSKTPRHAGKSLSMIVAELNPSLRGWYNYFKAGSEQPFLDLDRFVRRRLRAILDVYKGKRPFQSGYTNMRWPNEYFKRAGLFSMADARRARSILS